MLQGNGEQALKLLQEIIANDEFARAVAIDKDVVAGLCHTLRVPGVPEEVVGETLSSDAVVGIFLMMNGMLEKDTSKLVRGILGIKK